MRVRQVAPGLENGRLWGAATLGHRDEQKSLYSRQIEKQTLEFPNPHYELFHAWNATFGDPTAALLLG